MVADKPVVGQDVPASQRVHAEYPFDGAYEPALQVIAADKPVLGHDEPAGQEEQSVALSKEY
jgi:hypothetical protein